MHATIKGTITEHLTLTKLLKLGYDACIPRPSVDPGGDLLLFVKDRILKVQVKSSTKKFDSRKNRRPFYHFSMTKGSKNKVALDDTDCDIMAFVSYEEEKVFFAAMKDMYRAHGNEHRQTKRFKFSFFSTPKDKIRLERYSLRRAIRYA